MEERQDERTFFWENHMLNHKKNSSKSGRSGLRHCQKSGTALCESSSVLWRKTYQ